MNTSDSSSPVSHTSGAPPRRQIRLTGPSVPVDPQRYAVRRDLAELDLADRVFAQHYAVPLAYRANREVPVHIQPRADSDMVTTLGIEDVFHVLDIGSEWAWGRGDAEGSVGYVVADALIAP